MRNVGLTSGLGDTERQNNIERRIRALEEMDLSQLRAEWRRVVKTEPHIRLSADLLRRGVAFLMQEAAFGSLPAAEQRKLAAAARSEKDGALSASDIKAGTTLVREWHGQSHTVKMLEGGFDYQGRRYASLTKIAREITGAAWSGPRFFGVNGAQTQFRVRTMKADA